MEEVLRNTRRENLLLLLQGFPIEKEFAAIAGLEPSYLSRIKGSQPIGGKVARQIEHAAGKPYLWLDTPAALHPAMAHETVLKQPQAEYKGSECMNELIALIREMPEEKRIALLKFLEQR